MSTDGRLARHLASGLDGLGIALSPRQHEQLLAYLALLQKWNRVYNLTAIDAPERMLTLHLLDSLAILPDLFDGPLLDVGSGAGLPGIALAIARPELAVTLLDSSDKRCGFMRQAVIELGLRQVAVVHARVEDHRPDTGYAQIVARAFSDLAEFVRLTRHLLPGGGRWLALKGQRPDAELAALSGARVLDVRPVHVPGLDARRHIIIMEPA